MVVNPDIINFDLLNITLSIIINHFSFFNQEN